MKKILILFFAICAFSHLISSDISWSSPVTISSTGVDASDPKIVIDGSGNATAVWIESAVVTASSQPINGSWSAGTTISGMTASAPRLGADASGNVTAIWIENGVVNAASLPFGGSWSAQTAVSGSGASAPALSVDSAGNAVAVWIRNGFTESSRKLFGGSWSLVAQLTANASSSPDVGIGDNGTIVAIWRSVVSGSNNIASATSPIAGTWNTAVNVIPVSTAFTHDLPKVTVDPSGNATVLWVRYNFANSVYQNISLLVSTLPVGSSTWGTPALLTTGGETLDITKISTRIGVDTNGNVIALWTMSYDGSVYNIESATKRMGGSWGPVVTLQTQVLYAYQADLSVRNSLGDAVAAYMMFDGSSSVTIQSQESNVASPAGIVWSLPVTFSEGSNNGFPVIATSLDNQTINATSAWINFDGMNNVIVASSGSRTTIAAPTDLTVMQDSNDFGVFIEFFNAVSWTESTEPNIVRQHIYRDGVFFTSVDPGVTQVIDHNAIQNGSVTYGVSAEDSAGAFSPITLVAFP